jgi:hypothetical protein
VVAVSRGDGQARAQARVDALIAIGYSIQQPRPRHPDAATEEDRAALKKSSRPRLTRSDVNIRARASKSGRWMNTASA